jgi:hypothetical protein
MHSHSTSLRRSISLLVALSVALSLGGCDFMKKLKQKKEEAEAAAESASRLIDGPKGTMKAGGPRALAPDDPDQALGEKLNHPIECINGASMGVSRSHERYLGWVKDAKVGPVGNEQVVYGLYEVQSFQVEKCKKELAELASSPTPPTPDLDKVAADYAAKLDAVLPLVAEAYKYYDLKNYQDDKFAKGKSMHAPLMAAFESFETAATALHEQVGKLKAGLAERELERVEKSEGKKLTWHRQKLMLLAKVVADTGDVEDTKLDLAKLDAAIKDLETIDTALEGYVKEHPSEAPAAFSIFTMEAQNLLKAAKELHRRVRDKRPYSTGDLMMLDGNNGWMVEGTQAKLIRSYNDLVNQSNQVNASPF